MSQLSRLRYAGTLARARERGMEGHWRLSRPSIPFVLVRLVERAVTPGCHRD